MLHRKFWLHYHTLRFVVEVVATLGTAALFSYWILRTLPVDEGCCHPSAYRAADSSATCRPSPERHHGRTSEDPCLVRSRNR